jgi:hypothetical protein
MAIKIKKPLCKKVEKIAKSENKTRKKTTALSREERVKAVSKKLKLK